MLPERRPHQVPGFFPGVAHHLQKPIPCDSDEDRGIYIYISYIKGCTCCTHCACLTLKGTTVSEFYGILEYRLIIQPQESLLGRTLRFC